MKYCPPIEGHKVNQLFQYNPTSKGNTENGHKVTFRNDIMSVLGLDLGVPLGCALGNSLGFRPYFAIYPLSPPNTDTINGINIYTDWPRMQGNQVKILFYELTKHEYNPFKQK